MRLESALFTSREGITSHGQAIAVVGDNISNANTTAYKASRAEFADIMGEIPDSRNAESVSGAGDGSSIKQVRSIQENGVVEQTGRELDVGISGGGYFMVGDTANPQYTRAGNLEISKEGLLTSGTGLPILGYKGTDTTTLTTLNMYDVNTAGTESTAVHISGNLNASATVTTPPTNPTTFKQIAAVQSFAATQAVYDSLGARHEIQIAYFKTGAGQWTAQAYGDGGEFTGGTAGTPVLLGQTTLKFGGNGLIADADKATANIAAAPAYLNGATAGKFSLDVSSMTQYSGGSLINNVSQDGQATGTVSSYEFDSGGKVFAVLDNGTRSQIGSIPLATFKNNDGLQRSGTGVYSRTEKAGDPQISAAGHGQYGDIEGKSLERSTVDIAGEFVNLILFQRGYQANSQVLSAANQMLQNTIGLIR